MKGGLVQDGRMKRGSWADISESEETHVVSTSDMEDNSGSSHFHKVVQSLERRRPSAEIRPPSKNYWARKYHHLLADYQDQQDELEDLNEELQEAKSVLNEEKARCHRLKSVNNEMKKDLKAVIKDREALYDECLKTKALLKSRNADIESLVAQVKLLIQVGSIKRAENAVDSSPPEGGPLAEHEGIPASADNRICVTTNQKEQLTCCVIENVKKKSTMDNIKMELSSFFSARKASSAGVQKLSGNQGEEMPTKLPGQRNRCRSEDLDHTFSDDGLDLDVGSGTRNSVTKPLRGIGAVASSTTRSFWRSRSCDDA